MKKFQFNSIVLDSPEMWAHNNGYKISKIDLPYSMLETWSHPKKLDCFRDYENYFYNNNYLIECKNIEVIVWPFGASDINTHTIIGENGEVLSNPYQKKYYKLLEGTYVNEFNAKTNEISFNFSELQNKVNVDQKVCFIGGATNYTHWLTDILPFALLKNKFLPKLNGLAVGLNDTQSNCLQFMGISNIKSFIYPIKPYRICLKDAVIFSRPSHSTIRGLIKESLPKSYSSALSPHEGIYLYKSMGRGRISNEDEIINAAIKKNIQIIDVINTSFINTVELVRGAKHIYIPFGGSLGNRYFAEDKIPYTILLNENIINSSSSELIDAFTPISTYPEVKLVFGKQVNRFKRPLNAPCKFTIEEIFS